MAHFLGLNDFHSQNRIDCMYHVPHTFWMKCIDLDKTLLVFYGLLWQDKKNICEIFLEKLISRGCPRIIVGESLKEKLYRNSFSQCLVIVLMIGANKSFLKSLLALATENYGSFLLQILETFENCYCEVI